MVERHHPVHEISDSRIRRISFGNAEFDPLIEMATTSHWCLVSRGYEHNQKSVYRAGNRFVRMRHSALTFL